MQNVLNGRWTVDTSDPVGSGGFGKVFAATGLDGSRVVAKFVRKAPGAEREMLLAQLPASEHIVPVLDTAETETDWILIMPRAEKSLRDHIQLVGALGLHEAVAILVEIGEGLAALGGEVVHRDLKPENVLLLGGHWALCDFGISRYAEATTSPDTRKFSLSMPYASPEQWKGERATPAADVYALGVIAYELCVGRRPFPGPAEHDYYEQHLTQQPPSSQLNPRLDSLIMECLFKAPGARPNVANLLARLKAAAEESDSPGVRLLAEAQRKLSEQRAEAERQAAVAANERERRSALFEAAAATYDIIIGDLFQTVRNEAPAASATPVHGGGALTLGGARLTASAPTAMNGSWGGYEPTADVIAFADITLSQQGNSRGYTGRSHSMYYCDFEREGEYAWYELSFMTTFGFSGSKYPVSLPPGPEAGLALSNVFGNQQVARPIEVVRPGETDSFKEHWLRLLAAASMNELSGPNQLPEHFQGRHVIKRRR